jgi:hypothetical protein
MSVLLIFAISFGAVDAFLQTSFRDQPLMDCTKLISEQHFAPARPVVIVLPPTGEDSTTEELEYLITEIHTYNRWPILLFNTSYEVNGNISIEIYQHDSYIILISGSCRHLDEYIGNFSKQFGLGFRQLSALLESESQVYSSCNVHLPALQHYIYCRSYSQ